MYIAKHTLKKKHYLTLIKNIYSILVQGSYICKQTDKQTNKKATYGTAVICTMYSGH